jgi:hypothetical protein
MTQRQHLYTGRSGQLAAMAMFLFRGYNVAMPEVDVGEDIFVVRDADGDLSRIQVKAAVGKGKATLSGLFKAPLAQLKREYKPELFYVFTLYHDGLWREFIPISRPRLKALSERGMGHRVEDNLVFRFSFTESDILCSGINLQAYRNNWTNWPPIQH